MTLEKWIEMPGRVDEAFIDFLREADHDLKVTDIEYWVTADDRHYIRIWYEP